MTETRSFLSRPSLESQPPMWRVLVKRIWSELGTRNTHIHDLHTHNHFSVANGTVIATTHYLQTLFFSTNDVTRNYARNCVKLIFPSRISKRGRLSISFKVLWYSTTLIHEMNWLIYYTFSHIVCWKIIQFDLLLKTDRLVHDKLLS